MEDWAPDRCFKALQGIADHLSTYCLDTLKQHHLHWTEHHGFSATPLSTDEVLKDPVLARIDDQFPILMAGILMLPPQRSYLWHRDTDRGTSINMLLTAHDSSHCWFGKPLDHVNIDLLELHYQPQTLYLFNNQWVHTVFNQAQPRYLFSVEFAQTKTQLSYRQLLAWAQHEQLVEPAQTTAA